jgi:hypothetical protein
MNRFLFLKRSGWHVRLGKAQLLLNTLLQESRSTLPCLLDSRLLHDDGQSVICLLLLRLKAQ